MNIMNTIRTSILETVRTSPQFIVDKHNKIKKSRKRCREPSEEDPSEAQKKRIKLMSTKIKFQQKTISLLRSTFKTNVQRSSGQQKQIKIQNEKIKTLENQLKHRNAVISEMENNTTAVAQSILTSWKKVRSESRTCTTSSDKCIVCQHRFQLCLNEHLADRIVMFSCCRIKIHKECATQMMNHSSWNNFCPHCRKENTRTFDSFLYKEDYIIEQFILKSKINKVIIF